MSSRPLAKESLIYEYAQLFSNDIYFVREFKQVFLFL